jgi:hypothetical protein
VAAGGQKGEAPFYLALYVLSRSSQQSLEAAIEAELPPVLANKVEYQAGMPVTGLPLGI